jgi:type I restriction enzyme S subunit
VKPAAYQSYKPANSNWLQEIPSTWEQIRGRFIMGVNPSPERLRDLDETDEVSFVPMEAVGEYGGLNLERSKSLDEIGSGYTEFENGDVVVAKITPCFENCKGALADGLLNGVAFGTTELHVLRAGKRLDSRFLFYLTVSHAFRKLGESEMYGAGGQKRVPPEFAKNFRVPLPPLEEQQAIARFLDAKTAQIDTLVAKKRQLIAKLKEKRSALIARTATRGLPPEAAKAAGLEPNPEMKDSGIPWIGSIPSGWKVKRLKHISDRVTVGVVVNPSSYVAEEGVPFLLGGDVREFKIDISNCNRCSDEASRGPLAKSRLVAGDLVVVRVGYPGIAAVVPSEIEGANCASMMIVGRNDRFNSQWLAYAINAKSGRDQVELVQYGAAQKQFNISHAVDFSFPFPPIKEQLAIADYLDHECARLDRLTKEVETAIARLTEYRQALITSAVTGKIDVRNNACLREIA